MITEHWHSMKIRHFPMQQLTPVLFLFIIFLVLFNEINFQVQQIHRPPTHHHHHQQQSGAAVPPLNISSKCTASVEYKGRRVWPGLIGEEEDDEEEEEEEEEEEDECDFFSGRWVYDNTSYPLYNEPDCPYLLEEQACQMHGRPDSEYQHWRWQPHNCNLNRWNATAMWEKLRGKRLMFVGDSLIRGQWKSLVCLLQSAVPADKRSMSPNKPLKVFRAEEYNASVEVLWAPFLVESNSDDPGHVVKKQDQKIIRPDSTLRHSSVWKHADILIVDSWLWWCRESINLSWSNAPSGVCEEISGMGGVELALESWAGWMASNFDFLKKRAFLLMPSPLHQFKRKWAPKSKSKSKGSCYGEKLPILSSESYIERGIELPYMKIVNKTVRKLSPKVGILNITLLTNYRKDGHPTVYRLFNNETLPKVKVDPIAHSDCLHWCLPGVQDVWNQILFQLF